MATRKQNNLNHVRLIASPSRTTRMSAFAGVRVFLCAERRCHEQAEAEESPENPQDEMLGLRVLRGGPTARHATTHADSMPAMRRAIEQAFTGVNHRVASPVSDQTATIRQ